MTYKKYPKDNSSNRKKTYKTSLNIENTSIQKTEKSKFRVMCTVLMEEYFKLNTNLLICELRELKTKELMDIKKINIFQQSLIN